MKTKTRRQQLHLTPIRTRRPEPWDRTMAAQCDSRTAPNTIPPPLPDTIVGPRFAETVAED